MYGSLTGEVTARLDHRILIEVERVGYWVHTGSWQPSETITAYLYHHVREDANLLYGFIDIPTLALFERLLSVSGIGPKAALAILSLGSTDKIETAIKTGDATFLALAPGVGSKAAQKIILELKGKLPEHTGDAAQHQDVLSALESLGYKSGDIHPLLPQIPKDITRIEEQIRWVLQNLSH